MNLNFLYEVWFSLILNIVLYASTSWDLIHFEFLISNWRSRHFFSLIFLFPILGMFTSWYFCLKIYFSNFYLDFYIPLLFGILYLFSIWTFISFFYLDFSIPWYWNDKILSNYITVSKWHNHCELYDNDAKMSCSYQITRLQITSQCYNMTLFAFCFLFQLIFWLFFPFSFLDFSFFFISLLKVG